MPARVHSWPNAGPAPSMTEHRAPGVVTTMSAMGRVGGDWEERRAIDRRGSRVVVAMDTTCWHNCIFGHRINVLPLLLRDVLVVNVVGEDGEEEDEDEEEGIEKKSSSSPLLVLLIFVLSE